MKTVLVIVHDDAGQEARLRCAMDIVRTFDGHLVCLDVVRMPVIADGFGLGGASAALILDEREREDSNIEALDPRVAAEGISYEWARVSSNSDVAVTDNARLVDLLVVGRQGVGDLSDNGDIAARLAEHTSAPILLVPNDQLGFNFSGKALVTWDGSCPADAAIRAAVPLLKRAAEVEVVTIGESESDADPQEAAAYLARHGCNVRARRVPKGPDLGAQLLDIFANSGGAWSTLGSYGHSRLREQLFGGTTKTLLAKAPIPLLIAH